MATRNNKTAKQEAVETNVDATVETNVRNVAEQIESVNPPAEPETLESIILALIESKAGAAAILAATAKWETEQREARALRIEVLKNNVKTAREALEASPLYIALREAEQALVEAGGFAPAMKTPATAARKRTENVKECGHSRHAREEGGAHWDCYMNEHNSNRPAKPEAKPEAEQEAEQEAAAQ